MKRIILLDLQEFQNHFMFPSYLVEILYCYQLLLNLFCLRIRIGNSISNKSIFVIPVVKCTTIFVDSNILIMLKCHNMLDFKCIHFDTTIQI